MALETPGEVSSGPCTVAEGAGLELFNTEMKYELAFGGRILSLGV